MTFAIFESLTRAEPTTRAVPGAVRAATEGSAAGLSQWLVQSLDEIDYGMLMLDERGNVLYVNEAARSDLDRQHPLQLMGSRLVARGDDDEAALHDAVSAAARRGLRRQLTIGLGKSRVSVAIVPMESAPGLPSGATLLLLGRRQACQRLSIDWFARAHGLTPAETRVLEALAQGEQPREIAQAFDVGLATVRTQITCIRNKVGADSIRELLRMVGMLPPMRSALRLC